MKTLFFLSLIFIIIQAGCKTDFSVPSEEPTEQTSILTGEPKSYTFNVNPDSFYVAADSIVQIDFSQSHPEIDKNFPLPYLLAPERLYIDSTMRYYAVSHWDTFTVELLFAFRNIPWDVYFDSTGMPEYIDHSEIRVRDSTHADYRFRFFAVDTGMGYMQLSQYSGAYNDDAFGIIIGLAVEPLPQIQLHLDEIISTSTIDDFGSQGGLYISGTTNAYRLRSESYGDGCIVGYEIPINADGSFSANIGSRFIFGGTQFIHSSGKLAVYGCAGPPIIVEIDGLD